MAQPEKHSPALLIIIICLIILALGALAFKFLYKTTPYKNPQPSPEQITSSSLENCSIIQYSETGKTNIVFFSDKANAQRFSNYLLNTTPFKENQEDFNIFYIDNYQPECEIYKGAAVLCYNEDLLKKASSCPNDYIVVLKDYSEEIRSSSYMNVISLNLAHPEIVLPHEFGHAFANLADEYTPATLPKGTKNCASTCSQFGTIGTNTDGCFQGCSKESYYRSIDEGIMRTFDSTGYGLFDENLIENQILSAQNSTITGQAVRTVNSQISTKISSQEVITDTSTKLTSAGKLQSYELITISPENKITSRTLQQGYLGTQGKGDSTFKVEDSQGKSIIEGSFNSENIFIDKPSSVKGKEIDGGVIKNTKLPVIVKVPTAPKAQVKEQPSIVRVVKSSTQTAVTIKIPAPTPITPIIKTIPITPIIKTIPITPIIKTIPITPIKVVG